MAKAKQLQTFDSNLWEETTEQAQPRAYDLKNIKGMNILLITRIKYTLCSEDDMNLQYDILNAAGADNNVKQKYRKLGHYTYTCGNKYYTGIWDKDTPDFMYANYISKVEPKKEVAVVEEVPVVVVPLPVEVVAETPAATPLVENVPAATEEAPAVILTEAAAAVKPAENEVLPAT